MLRTINNTTYLKLGNDLFFFHVDETTCQRMNAHQLFKNLKRIHIFFTKESGIEIKSVAQLISYCYHEVFMQDGEKIALYCPKKEICEELRLQQVSTGWYNFFINLWDEIIVDGLEKPVEYMFYEDNVNISTQHMQQWDVEFVVPKQFSLYCCTNHPENPISRGIIYDYIYFMLHDKKEYEVLQKLTERNLSLRDHSYIVSLTDAIDEEEVIERGFHITTKEE